MVTHCFLDLFTDADLPRVTEALCRTLEGTGHWLFSDFDAGGTGARGLARRAVVAVLYGFFRATCSIEARRLPDFDRAFLRAGLEPVVSEPFAGGLLRTVMLRPTGGIRRI